MLGLPRYLVYKKEVNILTKMNASKYITLAIIILSRLHCLTLTTVRKKIYKRGDVKSYMNIGFIIW